jgi:hypothetical protein
MPFNRAPTSDKLRRAIDSGATGDKVDYPDAAAAPLGTDEEAGGRPPTSMERSMAFRQEMPSVKNEAQPRVGGRGAAILALCIILAAAAWIVWARWGSLG